MKTTMRGIAVEGVPATGDRRYRRPPAPRIRRSPQGDEPRGPGQGRRDARAPPEPVIAADRSSFTASNSNARDQFSTPGLLHRHAVELIRNLHRLAVVRDEE